MALQKPKKLKLYGKSWRNTYSTRHVSDFFDDATETVVEKTSIVKSTEVVAQRDAFDVPWSDDEAEAEAEAEKEKVVVIRHVTPPRSKLKRILMDDTVKSITKAKSMTAAERLAAQRDQANKDAPSPSTESETPVAPSNKRAGAPTDLRSPSPPKKARKSVAPGLGSEDVAMAAAPSPANCGKLQTTSEAADIDILDLPADDEEAPRIAGSAMAQTRAQARDSRRGKIRSSSRSILKKDISAPARLAQMLPVDSDTSEPPSRSSSVMRGTPSTPRRSATPARTASTSTAPTGQSDSPQTTVKATRTLTPKQAELWGQLLPSDSSSVSASTLAMEELTLSGKRRTGVIAGGLKRTLIKSPSDVTEMQRRRTRVVDKLRASAPSSDDEASVAKSDVEMADAKTTVAGTAVSFTSETQEEITDAREARLQVTRTQSQSQIATAEGVPKITYASQRSFMPEDSFEDGLMFDLPSIAPQRPPTLVRQPSKSQAASRTQQSSFHLEDSDDENAGGHRMRTVHELRAAGRNNRFMQETEGLLEDIADHSAEARSRRRGALIEIATKLLDKAYAKRFVGPGFEHKLTAELSVHGDQIADFVLATCFALLLVAETPDHTIRALKKGEVIAFLARLLVSRLPIEQLAKERKHNMAKAAQKTLTEFSQNLQSQKTLWHELKPPTITMRIIALTTLDLLTSRLRRAGDRSELWPQGTPLSVVLASDAAADTQDLVDTGTAVSLLEALSNSPAVLSWPTGCLEAITAALPVVLQSCRISKHTRFLALRLTLNLTNENAGNCEIFAKDKDVMVQLLEAAKTGFDWVMQASNSEPAKPKDVQEEQQQALDYDLLVLALGCMINLAEHAETARLAAVAVDAQGDQYGCTTTLPSLIAIFVNAQEQMENAESLSESTNNVAFGYLAVMLANLCQTEQARHFIKVRLPGGKLQLLIQAVEEFVRHHQKVDALSFEGEEGQAVWGRYTERLKLVLARLKSVAEEA